MLTTALRVPALRLPALERRHWIATLVLAAVVALNVFAGLSIMGIGMGGGGASAKIARGVPVAARAEAPPAPEPLKFREIAPQDAVAINAAVPISELPNPAARPFVLTGATPTDRLRAIECLTSAIYYEAATEPVDGQRAVAQVVLNRVRHPAYPNSVCGVVFQGSERTTGCQFTFTCDGALARTPIPWMWKRAREIAEAALAGRVFHPVGWATHYHTNWVVPYWSSSLVKAATVGTHIFYRWTGGWGTAPAFRSRYARVEPGIVKMRHLSAVPVELPAPAELVVPTLEGLEPVATPVEPLGLTSIDGKERAIVRRYEPARPEGIQKLIANQSKSGDAIAVSHRWALTGEGAGTKEAPLGRKGDAAKAAEPRELEGVRKVGDGAAGGAAR